MNRKKCLSLITFISMSIFAGCTQDKPVINQNNISNEKVIVKLNKDTSPKKKIIKKEKYEPIIIEKNIPNNISFEVLKNGKKINNYTSNMLFSKEYTNVEGILTFRGDNFRTAPSYGTTSIIENKLNKIWSFTTSSSSWGGGAGWTGQPSIVKWPKDIKLAMNIKDKFKEKEDFTEVIYASLDSNIYFLDLESGEQTRNPIKVGNPMKGSLSIDPRGIPILYVGEGIPEKGGIGYNIYSLIDGSKLHHINGLDNEAFRGWGAFDSSSLILKDSDTLIEPGENGILYIVKLNTKFNKNNKSVSINPKTTKYRYKVEGKEKQGIENSIAAYKNLVYFADNGGNIQCLDITTLKPVWVVDGKDDTDASLVLEVENDIPYVYSGCEVDKQGIKGYSYLKKINGLTGKITWEKKYECLSILGEHAVNGGLLATPVIGKKDIDNIIVFSLARYKSMNAGLMVALDKTTGKEIWRKELPNYVWSSPVDFYTKDDKSYIIQCDSIGDMYLLQGKDGKELYKINLGSNIEATPSIFNDSIVVATRGGQIVSIKIK